MRNQQKRVYNTPRLVEYGRVEEMTRGIIGFSPDWLFGNIHAGGHHGGGHSST